MELPKRIILPCGNAALLDARNNVYICNYCNEIIGSSAEPEACKKKRDETEPYKNDYWMDINGETEPI